MADFVPLCSKSPPSRDDNILFCADLLAFECFHPHPICNGGEPCATGAHCNILHCSCHMLLQGMG